PAIIATFGLALFLTGCSTVTITTGDGPYRAGAHRTGGKADPEETFFKPVAGAEKGGKGGEEQPETKSRASKEGDKDPESKQRTAVVIPSTGDTRSSTKVVVRNESPEKKSGTEEKPKTR